MGWSAEIVPGRFLPLNATRRERWPNPAEIRKRDSPGATLRQRPSADERRGLPPRVPQQEMGGLTNGGREVIEATVCCCSSRQVTSNRNCSGTSANDFRSFSSFSTPSAAACHAARSSSESIGVNSISRSCNCSCDCTAQPAGRYRIPREGGAEKGGRAPRRGAPVGACQVARCPSLKAQTRKKWGFPTGKAACHVPKKVARCPSVNCPVVATGRRRPGCSCGRQSRSCWKWPGAARVSRARLGTESRSQAGSGVW